MRFRLTIVQKGLVLVGVPLLLQFCLVLTVHGWFVQDAESRQARSATVEEGIDRQQAESVQLARQQLRWSLLVGTSAALIGSAGLGFVLFRNVGERINLLSENARRLADGSELGPSLTGSDEIAALDRSLHQSADKMAQAEGAIRTLTEEWEARVCERTAELVEANRDLSVKSQENEMFVYSVSHDLRSPLVSLQGFSKELGIVTKELRALLADDSVPEEIRARAGTLLDDDIQQSLRFIESGVLWLSNIIDALLRLSRVGRIEYHRFAFSMWIKSWPA